MIQDGGSRDPAAPRDEGMEARAAILIRYAEVFLKGRNRRYFEQQLVRNVERALCDSGKHHVERHHGRLVVFGPWGPEVRRRLERVFGISSFSPATILPPDLARIEARALDLGREAKRGGARSFRIESRRTDKTFPLTSPEVNVRIGRSVKDETGLKVDLGGADATIGIEIGVRRVFVFGETHRGPGGLPVGCGGRALLLLSGGIDSPVAGHLAQKRGVVVSACTFHSFPHTGPGAREKVMDLARVLACVQEGMDVWVVPFARIQERLRDAAPPRLLVVLYRRMMLRIAERIAVRIGARALVTGESLGQVASQTMESLDCIERATCMPVLRPLISFDKVETIGIARSLGTYDTSIRPFEDCCSLFVPKHPELRPTVDRVEKVEETLGVMGWVDEAVEAAERETIGAPGEAGHSPSAGSTTNG